MLLVLHVKHYLGTEFHCGYTSYLCRQVFSLLDHSYSLATLNKKATIWYHSETQKLFTLEFFTKKVPVFVKYTTEKAKYLYYISMSSLQLLLWRSKFWSQICWDVHQISVSQPSPRVETVHIFPPSQIWASLYQCLILLFRCNGSWEGAKRWTVWESLTHVILMLLHLGVRE